MNCTAEKQLSHGVFESFEIRKDSFFTVPQCEDTAPIQIGEILNNTYLITRFIAQGGMGIVYEGIDLVLHRKVAIKVLVTDFDDEEYEKELKLFQTEINLCGNLRHPNVIQIYYSGIHHRLPYLVMEYIEGIPINEYVMKQRRFNWNQKVKLISQVASGLAYIHKNNILHRDIKPSNILVKADGTPVLIDFGISIKKNLATVATNEGELSGTIHYMSPEQVAGEYDKINERSDIYSLGLILYELLIKRPAYTGSPNEIIGQIFNSSLLPPSDVNINISETLSNITMKAIAKEPEDRYSTATEFIEDLRLYLKNGNNQRVVKTVSLFEKVSYYLKPTPKIAVALGFIVYFFIAILYICACNNGSSPEYKKTGDEQQSRRDNHKSPNNEVSGLMAKEDKESKHEHEQIEESIPPVPPVPPKNELPKYEKPGNPIERVPQQSKKTQPNEESQPGEEKIKESPKDITTTSQNNKNITLNPGIGDNQQRSDSGSNNSDDRFEYSPPPPPEPPVKEPNGINLKSDNSSKDIISNWNSEVVVHWNSVVANGEDNLDSGSNSSQYILLNNKVYQVTLNENGLILTDLNVGNGYYYQKLWCQNELIIAYSICGTEKSDPTLYKIDLTNNQVTSYNLSTEYNINFDKGQFFTIGNQYYFLSSDPAIDSAILYQLQLEELKTESDTQNRTITFTQLLSLEYSPIDNTSIVVLKDTLYYLGVDNNESHSGLCEVKVSSPQVGSQELKGYIIEDINVTNSCSLLVTDNINRIWIINNINGVIEYNIRKKTSKKISNENDVYPVFSSSDSAVSFYSNGYLYCIVNNQAYMLYVGVSTDEKLFDMGFKENGFTPGEKGKKYPIVQHPTRYNNFVFVDDSLQIKLDKDNTKNKVSSFVKVGDKNTQENWEKEFLRVENDLNVIGIIFKDYFRKYYDEIKKAGYNPINNADSCSVLISEEYYSLTDWKKDYKDLVCNIPYKGTSISVPCLPFCCIGKLESNKDTEVKVISQWLKAYKDNLTPEEIKKFNFNQQEIEQFNYLDKKGCGITERCRLIYVIPNE